MSEDELELRELLEEIGVVVEQILARLERDPEGGAPRRRPRPALRVVQEGTGAARTRREPGRGYSPSIR